MNTYKITLSDAQVARLISYLSSTAGEVDERVAEELREQVKPAEPTEFGSIVRATAPWSVQPMRWQKTVMHGKHYWESETGAVEVWPELNDVEVLRIGVTGSITEAGEPS